MRRALLIANDKASRTGQALEQITKCLTEAGLQVEHGRADSEACYEAHLRERGDAVDLLVGAGGDGTVRCAADALLNVTGDRLPLGIIPLGTANNVARSLGLPLDLAEACRVTTE